MSTPAEDDALSTAIATAPRVSLADIEAAILTTAYTTGLNAVEYSTIEQWKELTQQEQDTIRTSLSTITLCIIVLRNGFVVIGKSAPASPENFDPDLGRRFARDDAIRQIWPLMGYALRERLSHAPDA